MKTTILMATVLTIATVLAAGLTVLPSTVQDAQANPCANEPSLESNIEDGEGSLTSSNAAAVNTENDNRECTFLGDIDID